MKIKESFKYARTLADRYITKSNQDDYVLSLGDLDDEELYKFAAIFIEENIEIINEACGPDNYNFTSRMIPKLLVYLHESSNIDKQIDFCNIFITCIINYFKKDLLEILDFACSDKYADDNNTTSCNNMVSKHAQG